MTKQSSIGTFALSMITISAILNLRGIPAMAQLGLDALWFYLIAAVGFLIPSTICCAVLAQKFPQEGGIYQWIKNAFGARAGFLGIWMEWTNNLIAVPATLATIITTVSFALYPGFAQHTVLFLISMAALYWLCTALNCLGIKTSSRLNMLGALVGTLLPGLLIISLGVVWFVNGHTVSFAHEHHTNSWGNLAFLISAVSGYSGMQITAFHGPDVRNPKQQFPLALGMACIAILFLSVGSALSVAAVLPSNQISLVNGVIESFSEFFQAFHLQWLTPVLAIFIAFGALACMSAWLIGPARGLHASAMGGDIPKFFKRVNQHGMPTGILLVQALVATALMSLYLFMPSISMAFWFLIVITSQFTILMYLIVFAACFVLCREKPIVLLCAGLGIVTLISAFLIGLTPPASLHIHSTWEFVLAIVAVDIVILGLPLFGSLNAHKTAQCH